MNRKPSATQVRGAVGTSGIIATLAAPWVSKLFDVLEKQTGMTFSSDYESQVLMAIGIGICYLGAHFKVKEISLEHQSGNS
jgi:hypothetical protein